MAAGGDPRTAEADSFGVLLESGFWRDSAGFVAPYEPGTGPRVNPVGWYPTGPDIGEELPPICLTSFEGDVVDVHEARASGPAVVSFLRSVVW